MIRSWVVALPSVDEPYPMAIAEALALGRPVVITDTCGMASLLAATDGAIVVGSEQNLFADAVGRLLDPDVIPVAARAAHRIALTSFSIDSVVDRLEEIYAGVSDD